MQCEQFEERLNQLLDRRLPPEADDALLAHAHLCGSCRGMLDAQLALLQSLDTLETPATSPDFSQRVVRQVVARRRVRTWRRAAYFAIGLAAGIVLAIFVVPRENRRDGGIAMDPVAPRPPATAPSDTPSGQFDPRVPDTAAMEQVAETPRQLPADPYAELMQALKAQQEQFVDAQKNGDRYLLALEDWSNKLVRLPSGSIEPDALPGGIKPLAESIGAAIELFQTPSADEPSTERPQARAAPASHDAVG